MLRILFAASAALLVVACGDPADTEASLSAARQGVVSSSGVSASRPTPQGEVAPYEIDGVVVRVNNRICAVSRTPMGEETLGQYVSRVRYDGPDPRFAGKTLEFNQCCPMCLDQFPQLWAEHRDEILRFHGLAEG